MYSTYEFLVFHVSPSRVRTENGRDAETVRVIFGTDIYLCYQGWEHPKTLLVYPIPEMSRISSQPVYEKCPTRTT